MEKSLSKKEYREPPVDRLARLLWEQCDFIVGIGVGAFVVSLIWVIVHMHVL